MSSSEQTNGLHNSIQNQASAARRKKRFQLGCISGVIVALAAAACSIYVAVHEPDSQETILLGQKTLVAGTPAGLRIVVRHRRSLKPVSNATVEVQLRRGSGNIVLGKCW